MMDRKHVLVADENRPPGLRELRDAFVAGIPHDDREVRESVHIDTLRARRMDVIKCALTPDDVRRYQLPPDFTKRTDSRRAAFVAVHGDVSVELDALPVAVLRQRVIEQLDARLDVAALQTIGEVERQEREQLVVALSAIR